MNSNPPDSAQYRTPADVREAFQAYPRRALILTTLDCEGHAVKAHLVEPELLIGERDGVYEYGRFVDPAGDWLVVHALTQQGNSDAGLVAQKAHHEFGRFHLQMFVGVAGSLKEDIRIGSVVVGDWVHNAHSAKITDTEILARPHGLDSARELLAAAKVLIYTAKWRDLIRAPVGLELPKSTEYPCDYPPSAVIKGIASGEEVVAGGKSARYAYLRSNFNDCGAVEMEGWGVMNAARLESTSAIIVRGISDMCAGKDHATDALHQPIAAAHAAAFAFSILSFRSRVPNLRQPAASIATNVVGTDVLAKGNGIEEKRIEFVLNFRGSKEDWPDEKVSAVIASLRDVIKDEQLTVVRVDVGSVRIVVSVRDSDIAKMELAKLREIAAKNSADLLGATTLESVQAAEQSKRALARASADLLGWEKTLPGGRWIERPEQKRVESRFELESSATVLLGDPGAGKSALLSKIAIDLVEHGQAVFALKADLLSVDIWSEIDLQRALDLPDLPSDLILRLAKLQPVFVLIDQLDALASQLDLRSGRLNVLLNLVRKVGATSNVHLLLSARLFEFNHDVRLRAIEADAITLSLPPWHEIEHRIAEVGIDPSGWPEKARDVVRIPQALKTFIALVGAGRSEPFTTYQAMLEELWRERIASAKDCEELSVLASDIASHMAEEEALWIAASRFDERLHGMQRLEALGFIVRSENNLSVAFSHQTVFEYILARTFVRSAGLLSKYVLERQDSLFVRAKVWSALNYLREAERSAYEREFSRIWKTTGLRRHLQVLLIEFLGLVREPGDIEVACMSEVLSTPELRSFGLKAIVGNAAWFVQYAFTEIRDAMLRSNVDASHATRILASNWETETVTVVRLVEEFWLPLQEKDDYSWMVINDCPVWTSAIERIAAVILERSPVAIWHVDHAAATIATSQPDVAVRLVRAKLDFLLKEAKAKSATDAEQRSAPAGSEAEQLTWYLRHRPTKQFEDLLDAVEWNDLPSLAAAAPTDFLKFLWPWYLAAFAEILSRRESEIDEYIFPGQNILELELVSAESVGPREHPLKRALQVAIEELAEKAPNSFLEWVNQNSTIEALIVQQLMARGFEIAAKNLATYALDWILADRRRFQLGTIHGLRHSSISLIQKSAPQWSPEEVRRFEAAVVEYRPSIPERLSKPEQKKVFADVVRATKKDLLEAVGIDRLAPANRKLVFTEQRALGDRFDRIVGRVQGGWIGSPMEAAAMGRAKDRDILKLLREIPDSTDWDHPSRWMQGGNIQLSRAFAEFARSDPHRAVRLIEQFESGQQERAASYALESMAEDQANEKLVLEAFRDLCARGFRSTEFRESASRAIEKIANRKADIPEDVIGIFVQWLSDSGELAQEQNGDKVVEPEQDGDKSANTELDGEEGMKEGGILWAHGWASALPGGNFSILSALASVLLTRTESARDRFVSILNAHLARESDADVWKALLYRLANAGGSSPQVVSTFVRKVFARFPEVLPTREAIMFLAHAQRWDDQLVFELIQAWGSASGEFVQLAYGELVGLGAMTKQVPHWLQLQEEIVGSGSEATKIGLANAAANLWANERLRDGASKTLIALLNGASKELVAAAMDVFRIVEELPPDSLTGDLLRALADSRIDMSVAPSDFVVGHLQALLPHHAELVAAVSVKLLATWQRKLGDIRTGTALAAPQLTDLALTLHRLGGSARASGVAIFESLIELDAYGARETLAEIDGRFGVRRSTMRPRLARRRAQSHRSRK